MCLFLMFQMDPLYALAALLWMVLLFRAVERSRGASDLSTILHGVMTQATRHLHVRLQHSRHVRTRGDWRPSSSF